MILRPSIAVLALPQLLLAAGPQAPSSRPATSQPAVGSFAVEMLKKEAKALQPLVKTGWVKEFLAGTARLPAVGERSVLKDSRRKTFIAGRNEGMIEPGLRSLMPVFVANEIYYYYTQYGSPLAYARPLDVLGQHGFGSPREKKILDFGFGTIGQLRLLAGLGAQVVGVDIDPLLRALYSEDMDQGSIAGEGGAAGSVSLLYGWFPKEERMQKEVGEGYDLIISKNTLKNGYIHPAQKVDDDMLVKLGVSEPAFVKAFYDILKPGGLVIIYNINPASDPNQPYLPWSDGRCPFPKSMWEDAGFKVLEFEKDDTAAIKDFARALEWDKGMDAMDVDHGLSANYTLLKRPAK